MRFRWAYLPYSMKMAGPREAIQSEGPRLGQQAAILPLQSCAHYEPSPSEEDHLMHNQICHLHPLRHMIIRKNYGATHFIIGLGPTD